MSALVFQGAQKPGFISHTSLDILPIRENSSLRVRTACCTMRKTQLDETQSLRLVLRTTFNLCNRLPVLLFFEQTTATAVGTFVPISALATYAPEYVCQLLL